MDRVFESGAAVSAPSAPASPSTGYPTAGNPATATAATKPGPWWFHMVTEELRALVAFAGLTPSHTDVSQVKTAIGKAKVEQLDTAFTSAGTAPNYTLTPSTAVTAYAAGQRFRVKFHAAGAGADQINVSGLGNKPLKQYDDAGAAIDAVITAGMLADVEYDGTNMVVLDPLPRVATATNDATFADNSSKAASTSWMRGAMLAIATAAGFAFSLGAAGYVKFPSWLGAWIIQWGGSTGSIASGGTQNIAFPIAFPNNCYKSFTSIAGSVAAGHYSCGSAVNLTNIQLTLYSTVSAAAVNFLAIGN
jgi:hypothetical protein